MHPVIQLVRAPAALTVPGDALAGAAAAGWPFGRRTPALCASAVCLYWAGMALNDYADRTLDAVERPERPIPSGKVSPRFALGLATGLTLTGLGIAAAVDRKALAVAASLAGTVWAYDLVLKPTPAGPFAMAAARILDVLLGAGGSRAALPAALTVGAHTLGITVLSRGEVHGASTQATRAAAATTTTVTAAALSGCRWASAALAGGYAVVAGGPLVKAVREPSAGNVRRAVGAGILGLLPLQASLIARAGAVLAALPVVAALPVARALTRKVAAT